MTLLFVDGFDHYATADISKKWTAVGGSSSYVAISSGTGRRGGNSYSNPNNNNSSAYISKTISPITSGVVGFAFRFNASPYGSTLPIFAVLDGGYCQFAMRINIDGTLSIGRMSGSTSLLSNIFTHFTVLATTTYSLNLNTYYYIELKFTISNSISADSCVLRINNDVVLTLAATTDIQSTSNNTFSQILFGALTSAAGAASIIHFDDLYFCDQAGSVNNNFLGDVRVDTIYPTSDGNYSQFTCSTGSTHYILVDETAPNTSDYNIGSATNDRDSYGLGNLSALSSQSIYGVQVNAALNKDDAGTKSAGTFVRSSSTNTDGAGVALSMSQLYVSQVYEVDPNTSTAWTESGVNAMEAGVKVTA